MRGQVQCQASILQALEGGPLYHTQLRQEAGLKGSTIYRHLNHLLGQQLITNWTETNLPYHDRRYYRITPKGRRALGLIQLTFDMLGLENLRTENL